MEVDRSTAAIVDSAMKIHSALGPGLLESVYERCLRYELPKRGLKVESQPWLPVIYDGIQVEATKLTCWSRTRSSWN